MAEPNFKWKSWDLISDDRYWSLFDPSTWRQKPSTVLITSKYTDPDNLGLEYETQLTYDGHTTAIARHKTYADALMSHKFYAAKYDLKKK